MTRDELLAAYGRGQRDFRDANLRGADLSGADLRGANPSRANLSRAYLSRADLSDADLSQANLSDADLSQANLSRADLSDAILPAFALCPEVGKFIAWKKLCDGVIAKLGIPASAQRTSSLVGRKCRASRAKVLALYPEGTTEAVAQHDGKTVYRVGEYVESDSYDPDIRIECTHGVHFFITRAEAEAY